MQTFVYINKATADDLAEIAGAEALCFSDAWSESSVLSQISSHYGLTVVAKDGDGKFLGYVCGSVCPPECEIFRVLTLPEHRRAGVARKMILEFVRLANARECEDFFIEVRESNIAARSLYASLGFSEIGKRKGYYSMPREDAVLLSAKMKANAQ